MAGLVVVVAMEGLPTKEKRERFKRRGRGFEHGGDCAFEGGWIGNTGDSVMAASGIEMAF